MIRRQRHRIDAATQAFTPAGDDEWRPLQPQTLVDLVIEALISQAARGAVLPGDRIVEAELARRLGVSRVPVREALRLLESQGIVLNEPYKGIRLRPVTNQRVHDLIEARTALETTAAHAAVAAGRNRGEWLDPLRAAVAEMDLMAARQDAYGIAQTDTDFHRTLCRLGGNSVVLDLWETLSRQSTIIFGLATLGKPMPSIVDEHRELLVVLEAGEKNAIAAALHQHITVMNLAVDYETILNERRARRDQAAAAQA
ncbi:MAG: GntR family transcriptional regulator [Rhizobiales bacterium 65-9]|nr:GntR family transcriptional regulator [Hyphomicrobiales bacterium]OJY37974.1 MAG: GntR family transcriptional regulator [Rhizobiales bacterium 65-9]